MADTKVFSFPENGNNANNIPFSIPIGGNGFGFGNGMNGIVDLFGLAIIASIFGWNNGGFGGITNQGEASRTAIQSLSTMLGQDFNLVNNAVSNVQNALSSLALQNAVSVPQIINAIQAGDNALASQLCKCCCDNQLATCQQTNALQNSINGVGQQVAAKAAADQLAMCQQTYALTDTFNRGYVALDNKIDTLESNRKDREITALTAEVAQLKSQNFTTGVVQQAVSPILGQLSALANEVDDIKLKMPNTVPVQYPNIVGVNATPYMGYYGGNGGFWG